MDTLTPILAAVLTGFLSGLLLSIPVGPINLTILNEGARRGFKWAALIGLGATVMEVIYCFIAFTSFASFFTRGIVKAAMELFSFVFLLFLGIKFLAAKSVQAPPVRLGHAADRIESRVEERFHPHSAFMTGLVRVMGNVGVLVFWIILAANFISREWVTPDWPGKLSCVAGVALGTGLWFVGLSWVVSLRHGRISEKTLLRMEHASGWGLVILALIHGGTIMWQMRKAQRLHGDPSVMSLPASGANHRSAQIVRGPGVAFKDLLHAASCADDNAAIWPQLVPFPAPRNSTPQHVAAGRERHRSHAAPGFESCAPG
jgi:threonine/homoserine/homoserine lactone efflux protein